MRFLIDAQLLPGLAARLADAGHEAVHIHEVLPQDAKDVEVAREADRRETILVTKDEDFVDLSRRGALLVSLLWIRLGNTTNVALWRRLAPLLTEIESAFTAGEKIVEIR